MQVNVLIARGGEEFAPELLVLPYGPMAAIPRHLQALDWRHLAVTMTDDKLLGAAGPRIRADIAQNEYAVVQPTG